MGMGGPSECLPAGVAKQVCSEPGGEEGGGETESRTCVPMGLSPGPTYGITISTEPPFQSDP